MDFADYQLLSITAAWAAFDSGHLALALERWDPIMRHAEPTGQNVWRAATATFHGVVATRRADLDRAATLLGFADAVSKRCGHQPFVYDRHHLDDARARLRKALGHGRFTEAHAHGACTPYEDLPLLRSSSRDAR